MTLKEAVEMSGTYRVPVRVKNGKTGRISVAEITGFNKKNSWLESLEVHDVHPVVYTDKSCNPWFKIFFEVWCYDADYQRLKEQKEAKANEAD